MQVVYVNGVWDLFHAGHLNALKQAKSLGDFLVVGINTDEKVLSYKRRPIIPFEQRKAIVEAVRCVDFVGDNRSYSDTYWQELFKIDVTVVGPGSQVNVLCREKLKRAGLNVEYVEMPRTPGVSTTKIMEVCCEERIRVGACPFAAACSVQGRKS